MVVRPSQLRSPEQAEADLAEETRDRVELRLDAILQSSSSQRFLSPACLRHGIVKCQHTPHALQTKSSKQNMAFRRKWAHSAMYVRERVFELRHLCVTARRRQPCRQ